MPINKETRISYYNLLPNIYQRGESAGDNEFLRDFLRAFEDVLLGKENGASGFSSKGLVEILERIQDYFDPTLAPQEFIEWLTDWVALDLSKEVEKDADNEDATQTQVDSDQYFPAESEVRGRKRHLIKKLAPLYHLRGTKEGLRQVIDIYFGEDLRSFNINELSKPFVIGDPEGLIKVQDEYEKRTGESHEGVSINKLLARGNYDALGSVVGRSTVVGEAPPYYFIVVAETLVPISRVEGTNRKRDMTYIINQEKPAHTYYSQKLRIPGMRVGIRDWCVAGVSTLIGGLEI